MPRSRDTVDASLELLLDTITNTFGSVLFITMLIAVLLRMSGRLESQAEAVSKTDQARAEARIAELSAESERLKSALDSLPPVDPELARITANIVATSEETARLMKDDSAITVTIAEKQEETSDIEQRIDEARKKLDQVKSLAAEQAERLRTVEKEAAELARIAVELDKPVDPTLIVQTAQLPRLTDTEKDQVGLYIRYGRVYVMHTRASNGERLGPNPEHFVIAVRPDGRQTARARPDAGYIADGATIKETLLHVLSRYPNDKWVVAVVVHEDSFAQFQAVKVALVELGYQYEPISAKSGQGVWDSGGVTARGQ